MKLFLIILGLILFLGCGFLMYCCCRVASIADRQDEQLYENWLKAHPKEAKVDAA